MELCVFVEPQQGASYRQLLTISRAAEDLGFDGFYRSDHFLRIGESDASANVTDAWITMAGLARETSRIQLGVLLSPATFRDPGPFAVTVAQVSEMSGGRIGFGLGAGWYEEEHRAFGIPFPGIAERFDRLEEQLKIITGLWETPKEKPFSYQGSYYVLDGTPGLREPARHGRPPIVVGGVGPRRTPRLAAEFADEYNVDFQSVRVTAAAMDRAREACARAGRDPRSLAFSIVQTTCCWRDATEFARRRETLNSGVAGPPDAGFIGSPSELVEKIGRYADTGVSRVYFQVLDVQDIDHLELLASRVASQLR